MSSNLAGKRKRGSAEYPIFINGGPSPKRARATPRLYGRRASFQGGLKFHDVTLDDAVVASGGEVTPTINIIAQGITESTRIGRKCTITSIWWRYQLTLPVFDAVAVPGNPDVVRMILYQDKQCNGATIAVTDLLETANFQSFRNLSNQGRFIVFMDKVYNMNYMTLASDNASVVSGNQVRRDYTFFKKCNIPIEFNNTTGAIGEIRSNNIGVLMISQSGVSGLNSQFRLRFSDI